MKELALIPARKGSKRLNNKNLLKINGKTLVEITIDLVIKRFDNTWFNSDSEEYLRKFHYKNIHLYKRPFKLGLDNVSTEMVVLEWINSNKFENDDLVFLFQPTSVFRNLNFLDAFISDARKLKKGESLISVSQINKISKLNNNCLESVSYNFGDRSQDILNVNFVKENGLGYAFHVATIKETGLFGKCSKPFFSDDFCLDLDIDTEKDYLITKSIIENGI